MVKKEEMTPAELYLKKNKREKNGVADISDWLQKGVPNLKCLSAPVIRRHRVAYANGTILPSVLIPLCRCTYKLMIDTTTRVLY